MRLWGWWQAKHPTPEALSCYLDNQVSTRERRRIEEHLVVCEHCREVLADLRRVTQWMKALPQEKPSQQVRVASVPTPSTPRLALPQWAVPTAVAAALLLVVLVATDLSIGLQARQTTPLPPPGAAVQPSQGVIIITPDIPKETGPVPQAPVSAAPASPHPSPPRPLLHWVAWETGLAGVLVIFLAMARWLRRRTT